FQGMVPGASEGPIHVFAGSSNASVMQASPGELKPVWIPGDRTAGITGYVASYAAKDPSGTVYVALPNGIVRVRAERLEPVLRFPMQLQGPREAVTIYGP